MSRTTGRQDGGSPGTRARLLEAEITRVAAVCFGEMGYRATTLDTVAARAGVSKVTLYKYVSSKEDLLWRVFQRTIDAFRSGLRQIIDKDLPADQKLRRIIRYQVQLLTSHLPFLIVFFSEESGLPPDLARRVAREKREYDRAIERVVRQGIAEGRVRDLPPTLLVFGLLGMCNWLYKWYHPGGQLAPEQIADLFVDLLEQGYAAVKAPRGGEALASVLHRIETKLAALDRRLGELAAGGEPPGGPRTPARRAPVRHPRHAAARTVSEPETPARGSRSAGGHRRS
ncbi:MAG: TetR family transcriptional regulator [Candidatus Rokubacteria bacterium]|nr:TetR family transcriptional regulator [Candidatus Rokubacteria bacterium]